MAKERGAKTIPELDEALDFENIVVDDGTPIGKRMTKASLKALLTIEGTELEPLVGGDSSATALVVANGPAGEQRTAEVSSGKWYDFGSGPVEASAGRRWKSYWSGTAWSLKDMGELPMPTVADNLNSVTGTTALSDKQGAILKEMDSTNSSVAVDDIKFWSTSWYWNDLTDTTKIVFARREDIQQMKVGKYNAALGQWITKDVPFGTVVFNRATKRKFMVNANATLTEIFDNLKYFSVDTLRLYPVLSTLKGLNVTRKTNTAITAISVVRFLVSSSVPQIIVNINDVMSGANPTQTFVLNINLSGFPDQGNILATAENDIVKVEFRFDFSNLASFASFNAQTLDKSLWGRLNNDQVNSQVIDSRFLKVTESFSSFFHRNNFSGGLNKDYAQLFRDMLFVYPQDFAKYKYFFRVIRKGYTGDGVGNEYQLLLFRQPLADTGLTNAVQIASLIKGSIDASGVELLTLNPYDASLKSKFYVLVDWNNIPSVYNGLFTSENNQLTELAFKGGNGAIRSQIGLNTFSDIISSRLDNVNLGAVNFKKSFFNADKIEDYMLTTDGAMPSSPKLTNLRYVNMGENIRFAGVDDENRYWFTNSSTGSIGYCNTIDDVLALNITVVRTFSPEPALCKKLSNGELLVVTKGSLADSLTAEVWVSSNNWTTWTKKLNFDNPNCETKVMNQWGCSIYGDHIVLSGYGKRYTGSGGEVPADAPKYTNVNERANYSIYYSFDGGTTWYNRLFDLGSFFNDVSNWKPYAHIHAVCYDPYWGEIMVTHGDLPAGLTGNNRVFRTTNLRQWEDSVRAGTPIALQWTNQVSMKQGGVGAMQHTMLFGSDDVPNGIYRASKVDKSKCNVELAYTEDKWKFQRTLRNPDGTPNTASDYGIWGGYTYHRRNNNQPMYITNYYFGGIHADDYKRNQIVATWDGYKVHKVWENDRDLLTSTNGVLQNIHLFVDSDDDNNILIQTRDSRFNPLVGGKPAMTNEYTLIIAKGI